MRFPIEEVINLDPPLGRTWDLVSEDIGDDKEGQAAKTCIEQHGAEILVSIAHQYRTYREYMMEQWQENDSPLGPSVHGGAIPGNLGGKAAEPIFRAQGLDEALGTYGSLYASEKGLNKVVIFATQVEGFQLGGRRRREGRRLLGVEVLARLDVQPTQPSYRAEAAEDRRPQARCRHRPGGVDRVRRDHQGRGRGRPVAQLGRRDRLGRGASSWEPSARHPIASQKGIGFPSFAPNKSTAAWKFFQPLWDAQADKAYDATGQYAFSTYDLMIQTALAVEAAGSYKASAWAPAMFEVGDGGEVCYTYADCLKLIRDGKDIDYEGVTGPGLYSDGGVNAVTPAYIPFKADGTTGEPVLLDAAKGLELIDQIATEAKCDPATPPNKCEW